MMCVVTAPRGTQCRDLRTVLIFAARSRPKPRGRGKWKSAARLPLVDGLNVPRPTRCCLASANRTQFRLFGRCKAVPHPFALRLEDSTWRGARTTRLVMTSANLVCTPNASQGARPVPAGFHRCHQCPFVTRSGECVQVMSLIFSSYTRAAREMSLFRFALDRVPPDFSCLSSIWDHNPRLGVPFLIRLFDATPLPPARPDCAKGMDGSAERH